MNRNISLIYILSSRIIYNNILFYDLYLFYDVLNNIFYLYYIPTVYSISRSDISSE